MSKKKMTSVLPLLIEDENMHGWNAISDSVPYEPIKVTSSYLKHRNPAYRIHQEVCFVGGSGTIKEHHPESGTWTYVIELELQPEPEFGRVGSETMIWLHETEIEAIVHNTDCI